LGRVHTPVNIDINIPPGARNGSTIKVAGRDGTAARRQRGRELHVRVVVEPHPIFRIDGDDIYFEVPITPWEAALGAEVEIGGIEGPILIRIPAGAQGGKRLRLRGEGLNRGDLTRGDAYVRLNIVVPKNSPEREKALYRELARITAFDPRSGGNSE
jgi:DnaJ-class molecular chaperone